MQRMELRLGLPVVGPHLGRLLAEAVHLAFALLVAGRVPREIVVNNSGDEVLKVDTF